MRAREIKNLLGAMFVSMPQVYTFLHPIKNAGKINRVFSANPTKMILICYGIGNV
jgi:hypothetical protein